MYSKLHKTSVYEEEQHAKPCQTPSATARAGPDLLKSPAILSDTTVRRYEVDREDLKPYWKSEKRPHFSW